MKLMFEQKLEGYRGRGLVVPGSAVQAEGLSTENALVWGCALMLGTT